jgi:hypothetical protein
MVLPRGAFTSGDGLTDQFQILLFDVVQRWLRKTRDYQILRSLNKLHAGCGRTKLMLWRLVQQGTTLSLLTIQGQLRRSWWLPLLSLVGQGINE